MTNEWTKKEKNILLRGVGSYGIKWFLKRLPNRTEKAIYEKARDLYGLGGLTKGAYSLNELIRKTGYSRSQLRRAMKALGQKWKKTSLRGSYLINDDQLNELIDWLGVDYWSKSLRLYKCVWCYRDDRKHRARGLCVNCYPFYSQLMRENGLPIKRQFLLLALKYKQRENEGYDFLDRAIKNVQRNIAIEKAVLDKLFLMERA